MDQIDRKILMQLQVNAKQNTKEIATKVGLTVTPIHGRIKKLESQGVITSYVAVLNKDKVDKAIIAYCQVSLIQHQRELIDNFKEEILKLSEIMECHHMSGSYDFLLKVAVGDMNAFQQFVNEKLSVAKGISNIRSSFVMKSIKETTAYAL